MSQQDEDFIIFEEMGKGPKQADKHKQTAKQAQPVPGNFKNLFEEIKHRCDPAKFMEPYNKEKVDLANEIYGEALQCQEDPKRLKELRAKAATELGVRFSTESLYQKLKEACFPQNFTGERYDSERVKEANRLYARILENADDVEALEQIETEASELISIVEKWKKEGVVLYEDQQMDDNNEAIMIALVLFFIVFPAILAIIANTAK